MEIPSHIVSNVAYSKIFVLLATTHVRVSSPQSRFTHARALIDQGSAATLISENLAQLLRLPQIKQNICVTGIGDAQSYARHTACIRVSPANRIKPAYSTSAIVLQSLTKYAPQCISRIENWAHVADLTLADNNSMSTESIDIIIGADLYGSLIFEGVRKGKRDEPIAQNTILGWILSDPISSSSSPESVHTHHIAIYSSLESTLRRFWEIEELPIDS